MNNHISFDEMAEFLSADRPDARFRDLSTRINAHIARCETCREMYMTMLSFANALDAQLSARSAATLRAKVLSACANLKQIISLRFDNYRTLLVQSMSGISDFYTPALTGIAKSTAGEPFESPDTLMVNDDDMQIDLSPNGMLTIRIPLEFSEDGALIALRTDDDPPEVLIERLEKEEDSLCARFYNLEPKYYTVLIDASNMI